VTTINEIIDLDQLIRWKKTEDRVD